MHALPLTHRFGFLHGPRSRATLRIVAGGALLGYLIQGNVPGLLALVSQADSRWLAAGTAAVLAAVLLSAYKWQIISIKRGLQAPLAHLVPFYFIGLFFNNFLPSSIGGDAVRAYELARVTRRADEAVASVITERLLASLALALTALFALAFGFSLVKPFWPWVVLLWAACGLTVAAFLDTTWLERVVGRFLPGLPPSFAASVTSTAHAVRESLRHRSLVLWVLVLSVGFQVLVVLINVAIFHALAIRVSLAYCFLFVPIISAVATVPVSVGGLGVREAAYIFCFSRIGLASREALAASLLFFTLVAAVSLIGGLIFVIREFAAIKRTTASPDASPQAMPEVTSGDQRA